MEDNGKLMLLLEGMRDDIHGLREDFQASLRESHRIETESMQRDSDMQVKWSKIMGIGMAVVFGLGIVAKYLLEKFL